MFRVPRRTDTAIKMEWIVYFLFLLVCFTLFDCVEMERIIWCVCLGILATHNALHVHTYMIYDMYMCLCVTTCVYVCARRIMLVCVYSKTRTCWLYSCATVHIHICTRVVHTRRLVEVMYTHCGLERFHCIVNTIYTYTWNIRIRFELCFGQNYVDVLVSRWLQLSFVAILIFFSR